MSYAIDFRLAVNRVHHLRCLCVDCWLRRAFVNNDAIVGQSINDCPALLVHFASEVCVCLSRVPTADLLRTCLPPNITSNASYYSLINLPKSFEDDIWASRWSPGPMQRSTFVICWSVRTSSVSFQAPDVRRRFFFFSFFVSLSDCNLSFKHWSNQITAFLLLIFLTRLSSLSLSFSLSQSVTNSTLIHLTNFLLLSFARRLPDPFIFFFLSLLFFLCFAFLLFPFHPLVLFAFKARWKTKNLR